eukprot:TRINITY_DN43962_c0_g1_i2.p1 TRINITY_DN43962_c0_g1~~TRINITY_DN43962_c0_g1_i2.p1  ORF type:complete len:248 (-),score=3.09 TRINITY_DN43962_c0_g1_i2:42-785(-)
MALCTAASERRKRPHKQECHCCMLVVLPQLNAVFSPFHQKRNKMPPCVSALSVRRNRALLPFLAFLVVFKPAAAASLAPAPTKDQLRAEMLKLSSTVAKNYPQYAKFANVAPRLITLVALSTYDFSALRDATILIPSDKVIRALGTALQGQQNHPVVYNITSYLVITKKYSFAQLRSFRPGMALTTQLGQLLHKMDAGNRGWVSFGKPGSDPSTWSVIKIPEMYTGPYFTAHGINTIQVPDGTQVLS